MHSWSYRIIRYNDIHLINFAFLKGGIIEDVKIIVSILDLFLPTFTGVITEVPSEIE